MTKEEKTRNARLLRTYGISVNEYDEMLKRQNGNCAICCRPPVNNRLAVDHEHKYRYVKIVVERLLVTGCWKASAAYRSWVFISMGHSRNGAIRDVRNQLKAASVRGLLCFPCNSGLRKYSDDFVRFLNAAEYLKRHQNKE